MSVWEHIGLGEVGLLLSMNVWAVSTPGRGQVGSLFDMTRSARDWLCTCLWGRLVCYRTWIPEHLGLGEACSLPDMNAYAAHIGPSEVCLLPNMTAQDPLGLGEVVLLTDMTVSAARSLRGWFVTWHDCLSTSVWARLGSLPRRNLTNPASLNSIDDGRDLNKRKACL